MCVRNFVLKCVTIRSNLLRWLRHSISKPVEIKTDKGEKNDIFGMLGNFLMRMLNQHSNKKWLNKLQLLVLFTKYLFWFCKSCLITYIFWKFRPLQPDLRDLWRPASPAGSHTYRRPSWNRARPRPSAWSLRPPEGKQKQ